MIDGEVVDPEAEHDAAGFSATGAGEHQGDDTNTARESLGNSDPLALPPATGYLDTEMALEAARHANANRSRMRRG